MTYFRSIFLLLMSPALFGATQFCASDGNDPPPIWDNSDICSTESFANLSVPPVRNITGGTSFIKHDCSISVILDLDQSFTSQEDYGNVLLFIKGMVNTCMDRGIGYKSYFYPMFNDSVSPSVCCDEVVCSHQIGFMGYDDFVGHYETRDSVQNETEQANFTYVLIGDLKPFAKKDTRCLYNTVVLLTNRLFNYTEGLPKEVFDINTYGCISFTVVVVGNKGISDVMLQKYYSELTPNLYNVQSFNCLPNLNSCIRPCGPMSDDECAALDLDNCPAPTTTAPTTTTVPTTPSTTPLSHEFDSYWHIIYLFALSNRTSTSEFQDAIQYVLEPLQNCLNDKTQIVVRFLAKNDSDSGWLTNYNDMKTHLEQLQTEEVLLDASRAVDVYDNTTLELIIRGVGLNVNQDKGISEPRLTLLTDFVSQNFLDAYNGNNQLIKYMEPFDFEIYCFDEEAAEIYENQTVIKPNHIHADPNFATGKDNFVEMCKKTGGTSVPTIMIIIIGTCTGAILLLIIATILYRQKYKVIEKLHKFKTSQSRDEILEEDIIDYWELSWSNLVVKNERLGNGAYGQVFKGKLIGPSPGIDRYHKSEIAQYTDCDCAVKMLPQHASDSAKEEFMHEINLMKTLGCNDHIVNMLGCITTGKSCLVLEYCSKKDLGKYLKQRKVELEIVKSVDEDIECTKVFLTFAWQIAQGMKFLGVKNIVHRDLAARNILITGPDSMLTAKISDFGLSLNVENGRAISPAGRLPIKWLALESLISGEFSYKTDVWSYGIILFEMYSMGEVPYPNVEPNDMITHLEGGNRPKRPLLTSDKIYEVMMTCWDEEPAKRPNFQELGSTFAVLLEQASEGYGYLALIKSSEHYRILPDVTIQPPAPARKHDVMDMYYSDEPCKARGDSQSSRQSRIQIDGNPQLLGVGGGKDYRIRTETGTDVSEYSNGDGRMLEGAAKWAERIRRRKSQIAALNPFKKGKQLPKEASPTRESTSIERRGSVPY